MNSQITQLLYSDGNITSKTPDRIAPSSKDFAVIFHVFYIDLWPEIKSYLDQLSTPYDLFVTVPEHMDDASVIRIFNDHPNVTLYRTENRGRDVLPFLLVMDIIGTDTYPYICKLHTKKTGDSPLGHVWRKLLYFDLLGSDKTVKEILSMFKNDPDIGMITGKNTILDSERYDYGNTAKIDKLVDMSGFLFQDTYLFAGGTMFWIRAELIEPILTLFREGKLDFEEERGQKDNTVAHAIERFFGIICHVKHKKIAASPSRYSELDDRTLDEVAQLVLSQQYHGEDVFNAQKQTIHGLYAQIDELKELADLKKRFKNKIKKHIPTPLFSLLKNSKRALGALKNNPDLLKKVFYYLKRGEIRYLIQKINEKSITNIKRSEGFTPVAPQHVFTKFAQSHYHTGEEPIDIIIPVYNGYAYLENLFDSIERYTTAPYRLIVINDAGDDTRVLPYLKERLQRHPDAILIEHTQNIGFVKSVNEAFARTQNHFVILNTDTEVPAFWLERLMYPILHMENIASTTPFTNAGTIASFPVFLEDNPIFGGLSVEILDRVFRNVDPKNFYETLPTGVGFCMGVNRDLAKEIGFFDEENFGKGYGEENDWCQRAIKAGYRNLLVPNLFVYHKHGGSFNSEEKKRLIANNAIKLLKKHPDYDKDVQTYIAKDPHKTLRELLIVIASSKKEKGIHLIIDHALGGGANQYAKQKITALQHDGERVLYTTYDFYLGKYMLHFTDGTYDLKFSIDSFEGLKIFLSQMTIGEIFLNSLVSFNRIEETVALIKELQEAHHAKLIIPIHDYYPVCPSYTLLNDSGAYCHVPDIETCKACMEKNHQEWRTFFGGHADIPLWRSLWRTLLEQSTDILCFSNASKDILLRAYPALSEEKIALIPHKVTDISPVQLPPKSNSQPLTIGILGAINYAKGAKVIKELVEKIDAGSLNINVVVIGEITEPIRSEHFTFTGKYDRNALPDLITQYGIDIFLIPSIWPETFSYTAEEIMQMRLPLMVFDLGAPAERVKHYENGFILHDINAASILKTVHTFQSEREA